MNTRFFSRGAVYMLLSNAAFCGMALLVRAAAVDARVSTFYRFIIGMAVLGTGAMMGLFSLRFMSKRELFFRGLFGGISTFIYFRSITTLGVGKSSLIGYTYPVFAALFSTFIAGERLNGRRLFWIVISFTGMAVLLADKAGGFHIQGSGDELIALFGAVLSGLAVAFVKKLHETDDTFAIFFAQCMGGFWILVIPAASAGSAMGYGTAGLILCIGLLAAAGQLFMTESYRTLTVSSGSLLAMLVPVFNAVTGVFVFGENVTYLTVVGGAIVITGCAAILREKHP